MLKRLPGPPARFALAGLVAFSACKPGGATKGEPEAGGPPATETAPAPVAPTAAASAAQVAVTNAMPHAMTVSADWGDGPTELGIVEGGETKTFDLEVPAGTRVRLTATDREASHSASGSVTLSETAPADWTVQ